MAVKPALLIPWDSGGVNLVAVTGTHQANGFANSEIPTSGEQNTWQQNTYLWLLWLIGNIGTVTRNRFPSPIGTLTGYAFAVGGTTIVPSYSTTAVSAGMTFDLDVPQGYKLSQLKFAISSATASPGGSFVLTIFAGSTKTNSNQTIATYTVPNGSFPITGTDQVLNLLTSSTALTVTVAAAGGTYTRSAGSFLTDGNFVGQIVQWAGFVNAGNNGIKTITALSATVMTVAITGLVNETGSAGGQSATGVSPVVDDNTVLYATIGQATSGGFSMCVGAMRSTIIPQ